MTMRARVLTAGMALAVAALAAPGAAQDQSTQLVDSLLTQARTMADARGLKPTGGVFKGGLNQGGDGSVSVDLQAGRTYTVIGVCDTNCSDFNLTLFDPAGATVVSDVLKDDTPVLAVAPRSSGTYRLKLD